MKRFKGILFLVMLVTAPLMAMANMNGANFDWLLPILVGLICLLINYPFSFYWAYRARLIRSRAIAIIAFLSGSVYMFLWIYFICLTVVGGRDNIDGESAAMVVFLFLVALFPFVNSIRACLTVFKKSKDNNQ